MTTYEDKLKHLKTIAPKLKLKPVQIAEDIKDYELWGTQVGNAGFIVFLPCSPKTYKGLWKGFLKGRRS